ncbi:hypothetical protein K1719_016173 [Acacia pycnantha]|nr:hypothetical protein K1719_016173 [Acacia pycnantha]
MVVDMAIVYGEVSAEYLGSEIVEPPWLNYFREWGPKISYNVAEQLKKVQKRLPGKLKKLLENMVAVCRVKYWARKGPLVQR